MSSFFLFIDESHQGRFTAIGSLLVPVAKVREIRSSFYERWPVVEDCGQYVVPGVPELHGSSMPGENEEERLSLFRHCVEIVNRFSLGFYTTRMQFPKENLLSRDATTCFYHWIDIEDVIRDLSVIPVMDRTEFAASISGTIQTGQRLKAQGLSNTHLTRNFDNFLGEVFFAESKYCPFIQIVDVCLYLTVKSFQKNLTGFGRRLALLAEELEGECFNRILTIE
jgi:hypothetical protein